jgi:hypothetical protein
MQALYSCLMIVRLELNPRLHRHQTSHCSARCYQIRELPFPRGDNYLIFVLSQRNHESPMPPNYGMNFDPIEHSTVHVCIFHRFPRVRGSSYGFQWVFLKSTISGRKDSTMSL